MRRPLLLAWLLAAPMLASTFSLGCPYMDAQLEKRAAGDDDDNKESRQKLPGDDGFLDKFKVNDGDVWMTTDTGTPVDDRNSLRVGNRGPTLMEDFVMRTKIQRFDHERVPERAVHARGAAAQGYFESYADWSNVTAASFLGKAGKQTPILVRFSTVAGSRGSADTVRDVHGFAMRFYTDEGNYDIVGNNIPVFFIQDGIQFPDLIHSVKPRPDNEMPQAATAHDTAWDFFSNNPTTLHTLLWALSGHGIPRSYRHMDGFGVHTFRFVTDEGKSKLVKFHFKSQQGLASLVWEEAQTISGHNPDFHRQDLFDSIDTGNFPEWELSVQMVDEEDVLKYGMDLLDATKILPVEHAPLVPLGKFVLNKNPTNYFVETEQAMFSPGHVVRGIDFSDDPLLNARLFSYTDTQINRNMGSPNFEQLPINRPRNGVHNNNRDGAGQQMIHTNIHAYSENTLNGGFPRLANFTQGNGFFTAPARRIVDAHYVREVSPTFLDYWSQPRLFWNSLVPAERQMVVDAARFELSKVNSSTVRQNAITQFNRISHELATRVATAFEIDAPAEDPRYYHDNVTEGVSTFKNPLKTIASLNIGIVIANSTGNSLSQAQALREAFSGKKANAVIIAPLQTDGIDMPYSAANAALLDAVVLVGEETESEFKKAAAPLGKVTKPAELLKVAFALGKPVGVVGWRDADTSLGIGGRNVSGVYVGDGNNMGGFADGVEEGLKTWRFVERFQSDEERKKN